MPTNCTHCTFKQQQRFISQTSSKENQWLEHFKVSDSLLTWTAVVNSKQGISSWSVLILIKCHNYPWSCILIAHYSPFLINSVRVYYLSELGSQLLHVLLQTCRLSVIIRRVLDQTQQSLQCFQTLPGDTHKHTTWESDTHNGFQLNFK